MRVDLESIVVIVEYGIVAEVFDNPDALILQPDRFVTYIEADQKKRPAQSVARSFWTALDSNSVLVRFETRRRRVENPCAP